MNTLAAYIVDDEFSARNLLADLLEDVSFVRIAGEADCVEDAFRGIQETRPDVILLDVQMPRKDGFVLIEQLQAAGIETTVIFITAYEQYAVRAIRASAFDYLLKPVKKSELVSVLDEVRTVLESKSAHQTFSKLLSRLDGQKKIKFRDRTGFTMVDPDELIYCRADSNYTVLMLKSERSLTVAMHLGKVEDLLPGDRFCRISRSIIINIDYLAAVDRKSMTCNLTGEEMIELPVSRNYLKELEAGCNRHFKVE
jgi:two-component system LytT family response regulator